MRNLTPAQIATLATLVQAELESHAEHTDDPTSADAAYSLDLEELLEALKGESS